ncbi:hypothetical protein EZS27_012810 [termite gut metagenome]|uniref:DUF4836 family protein n=1 Tax=termite gut metagenome TaxID=433724 RepID=A0A5J4RZ83_9ZZZZ
MTKKVIYRRLLLVVFAAAIMASCKDKSSVSYTNVIPADASIVVSFHLKAIWDKVGLNEKENGDVKRKLTGILKEGIRKESFDLLEKIVENPTESGIDMEAPFYIFTQKTDDAWGIAVKVGNRHKLKALLDVMVSEGMATPVKKRNGYSYVRFENSHTVCAFNEDVVLAIHSGNNNYIGIDSLMLQKKENSISVSPVFRNMLAKKGEIKFMATPKGLFPDEFSTSNNPKDAAILSNLSFENGKINLQVESHTQNEKLNAWLETNKPQEFSFIERFPISTLAYLTLHLDGGKLVDLIQEDEELYDSFLSFAGVETLKAWEEFIRFIDGDLSVGLLDVSIYSASLAAYAKVKDNRLALQAFYNLIDLSIGKEAITSTGNGSYVYKFDGQNIYFGVEDKQFYVTNNKKIVDRIPQKIHGKTLKDAEFASNMKETSLYLVVNMENMFNLPVVRLLTLGGRGMHSAYMDMASGISYLEVTGKGNMGEINLCFKDKKTNALKQIVNIMKQHSGL